MKAGAAAGVAMSMMGGYVAHAAERKTYRVGLIGCGWYGKNDLFRLIQVAPVEVVSMCDVDKHMLAGAADMVSQRQQSKKRPRLYGDYRQMLKEKDLDIVLIGSPDFWHPLQMIAAVESGADVYVQKPICRDVLEGEAMVAAARKHGRVVQVGTQRKSAPHMLDAKKNIVDAGLLGKVSQVDLCCYYHMRANGDPPLSAVPDWFDYEMWTGPAPMRPYDMIPHKRWWRTFYEYGNGIVGDMCIHMFDAARFMLGLSWPNRVSSVGGIYVEKGGKSTITDTQTARFEYPELIMNWQHRTWGGPADPQYPWAMVLHGEKGTLKASSMSYDFIPEEGQPASVKAVHKDAIVEREKYPEDVTEPDIDLEGAPATRNNLRNFLEMIESRGKGVSDIEQGHISTASCILANVSMQLGGRPLSYDPVKRQVVGDAEATALLRRAYRDPWKHPAEGLS
jgi:predicted dehydrogenase